MLCNITVRIGNRVSAVQAVSNKSVSTEVQCSNSRIVPPTPVVSTAKGQTLLMQRSPRKSRTCVEITR